VATYRLQSNERCDWREVLQAHAGRTMQLTVQLPVVLFIQDTTELDFNGQTITGLCYREVAD
jgi:hypothetical protein